jgi:hypothetical protein
MYYDFNCRTQEETRTCLYCGYNQEWALRRDDEGNFVKSESDKFIMDYTEKLGYGSYQIANKDGSAIIGTFSDPLTQSRIRELEQILNMPGTDKDESYLIRWDPETKQMDVLFGKAPECDGNAEMV